MADFLDYDQDFFSAPRRRTTAYGGSGGTAVPRTTTQTVPGLQPSATPSIAPGEPPPGSTTPPAQAQDYSNFWSTVGPYANRTSFGDIWNLDEKTPKRLIGRVASHFDPSMGFNDDMLKALNALDIGDFGFFGKDNLQVRNARNNPGWGSVAPGQIGSWDLNAAYDPAARTSMGWQFQDLNGSSAPATPPGGNDVWDEDIGRLLGGLLRPPPWQTQPAPDMSWLQPLLESLRPQPGVINPAQYAPVPAPGGQYEQPSQRQAPPTFQGYAETPMSSGGDVSRAMQILAMNFPRAMARGTPTGTAAATDPLLAQIARMAGVT